MGLLAFVVKLGTVGCNCAPEANIEHCGGEIYFSFHRQLLLLPLQQECQARNKRRILLVFRPPQFMLRVK